MVGSKSFLKKDQIRQSVRQRGNSRILVANIIIVDLSIQLLLESVIECCKYCRYSTGIGTFISNDSSSTRQAEF
jgi:hypothetical protein